MAFIAPALPTVTSDRPRRRSTPRAAADGQIAVSRRRRVFEFLQQAGAAPASSSPTSVASVALAPSAAASNGVTAEARAAARTAARAAVAERLASRQAAVAADAARKREEWEALLDSLRTPPPPPPAAETAAPKTTAAETAAAETTAAETTAATRQVPKASPVAVAAPPTKPKPAPVPAPPPVETPPLPEPTPPAPPPQAAAADESRASTVSELYAPPPPPASEELDAVVGRPAFLRGVVDAAAGAVKSAANILENIAEDIDVDEEDREDKEDKAITDLLGSVVDELRDDAADLLSRGSDLLEDVAENLEGDEVASEEVVEDTTTQSAVEESGVTEEAQDVEAMGSMDTTKKKTFGEKILDAIVEGVDTPSEEQDTTAPGIVDKTELLELVETGKIKNLTVTKLRRLLSMHNLKTSGRKSELIARLTSFAKSK